MTTPSDNDRPELSLDALEYLLGDVRGEDIAFEQRLLDDPNACDCLADLVVLKQAAEGVRDNAPSTVALPVSASQSTGIPSWVTTLAGLAAMLLVGLWVGYQWGDRDDDVANQPAGTNEETQAAINADLAVVWQPELMDAWSDLSDSADEIGGSEYSHSEDELDAAYDAALSADWNAEASVPDWMWAAVSTDEMNELQNDDELDFEFEETL